MGRPVRQELAEVDDYRYEGFWVGVCEGILQDLRAYFRKFSAAGHQGVLHPVAGFRSISSRRRVFHCSVRGATQRLRVRMMGPLTPKWVMSISQTPTQQFVFHQTVSPARCGEAGSRSILYPFFRFVLPCTCLGAAPGIAVLGCDPAFLP